VLFPFVVLAVRDFSSWEVISAAHCGTPQNLALRYAESSEGYKPRMMRMSARSRAFVGWAD
jgi:hypothetical protein